MCCVSPSWRSRRRGHRIFGSSFGNGAVSVHPSPGWKYESFALYNDGTGLHPIYRPVVLYVQQSPGLNVSYIAYRNDSGAPTSESCLKSAMVGALRGLKSMGEKPKDEQQNSYTRKDGKSLAVDTYNVPERSKQPMNFHDVHAAYGDTELCVVAHVSKVNYKPEDQPLFEAALDAFGFDTSYVPQAADYSALGELLTKGNQHETAQLYYARAIDLGGPGYAAKKTEDGPNALILALANHPGSLAIGAPGFVVTELSAKPNGIEYGVRAKDKQSGIALLGFLYLPVPAPEDTAGCMNAQLQSEMKKIQDMAKYESLQNKRLVKDVTGHDVGVVDFVPISRHPLPLLYRERIFIAQGDLCADIELSNSVPITSATLDSIIASIRFDPSRAPDFWAKFRFATVLRDHRDLPAAAPIFADAIPLADAISDPQKWRRVATDEASMAYGMSGDLAKSRALNEAAIAKDPDYPLYYYNLACADAEAGNAAGAKTHLEQAYSRRKNTLPGEMLPDASQDDSFQKLKGDKAFWAFVQSLPRN